MFEKVRLFVGGKVYDGWKEIEIKRSLRAAAGAFSLSLTDRWSGQNEPWIISPEDPCEVRISEDVVITGYADTVSPSMEAASRSISVSGRDKTSDLIDCSIEHATGEISGATIKRLAEIFCKPFGIPVVMEASSGAAFDVFKIQQGETVFEALDRAARKRGLLISTDAKGSLVMTTPGRTRAATPLVEGENILSGSATFDHKQRFSKYIAKGQETGFNSEVDPAFAYGAKGVAVDKGVKRYRPLIIQAEQLSNLGDAKARAEWEATVRAARAAKFNVNVQGWRQADGSLWRPNIIVPVRSKWLGVDGDYLLTDVSYRLSSEGGSVTSLAFERKDAYKLEPEIPEKQDPLVQAINKDPGFRRAPK